jgi:hypothetical protein
VDPAATATRTSRRTVRTAVALVIGQALLCAVIGWLTFGRPFAAGPGGDSATIDRMAAPPPIVPVPTATASTPAPSTGSSAPAHTVTGAGHHLPPPPPQSGPAGEAPPLPAAQTTGPEVLPEPSTEIATGIPAPTTQSLVPPPVSPPLPPAPTAATVQQPVVVGGRCGPPGAYGRTADGIDVRCQTIGPHRTRWKIAYVS